MNIFVNCCGIQDTRGDNDQANYLEVTLISLLCVNLFLLFMTREY